jgi:site-specific DNA-methyltransferase (adenine-specific)
LEKKIRKKPGRPRKNAVTAPAAPRNTLPPADTDKIVQGDCIAGMAALPERCIDLTFADPPFNIGYDYDEYDDKRSCDDYLEWSKRWIGGVIRVLRPGGSFWLAIGDEYAAELKVLATRELGLSCRGWIVWYYTFGVHCKAKFTRSHAHIFYFTKPGAELTFHEQYPSTDPRSIRVPSARQLVYADKRANPMGRLPDDTWIIRPTPHESWILRPQDLPERFTADSDTWYFPRVCGTFKERMGFHGCQMPEHLLARIIRAASNEGDVVMDPFTGSGTTLAVAKKLDRRYVGFELSKEYAEQSNRRLAAIHAGDPLDGTADPLTSVVTTANGKVRTEDGRRVANDGAPRKKRKSAPPAEAALWD